MVVLLLMMQLEILSGPWNGVGFSGVPEMKPTEIINFEFQMNKDQVYYTFEVRYKPKNQVAWDLRDGSAGCVRDHDLDCETDVFNTLKNMKLPESGSSFVDKKMNLDECEEMCRYNCSCTAYTTANVTEAGSGCVIWTKELVDMRQYSAAEGGQVLYVRVAASDAAQSGNVGSEDGSGKIKRIAMATGITAGIVLVLIGVVSICLLSKREKLQGPIIRKKTEQRGSNERSQNLLVNTAIIPSKREISGETVADEFDLPLFDLSTLAVATEDFSDANKLGQGGFGCVYKGIIDEDQVIAVKRLSKNSGQGVEEFKNELRLIARLQHRNLVRLLGCCVEMEEKIGYMSPEYAMDGLFSVKSDVFSFGVLVLEIVTGKKNRGFYFQNNQRNLLGHAWRLWIEGGASELLDSTVGESFSPCEVMRCIQVGLLCVQEQAEDRPNMATVVLMLGSESATLPQPKHPGFCLGRRPVDDYSETVYEETFTVNEVTVTVLDPR
ncbi:hypothetical protein RND71_012138 [Anisodus tanguticus]|uniref:Uncharacterized protein n=1 Tax=Anisodus tanguticus TaxID=243964 RepID=A0AAE1SGE8_9SOLA|nr:hypothetical protein RND71_012138 [Anisodus tanguticus]